MANLSNELGISKNQKVEILLEMGYKLNPIVQVYVPINGELSLSGTKAWINDTELESCFISKQSFIDWVKYKLTK
jgi:hypothetical protein